MNEQVRTGSRQRKLGVAGAVVDDAIVTGDVVVDTTDGTVLDIGAPGASGSGLAVPGFIDLQVNGFAGVDFLAADPQDYATAGAAMAATGVTAFAPTLITADPGEVLLALKRLPAAQAGPKILGAHIEGPFLSPERMGTHPVDLRRDPDARLLERYLDTGQVRILTLAPELTGAHELVRILIDAGVLVSIGHSDAGTEEAHAGFDAGIRAVTHLGNAMRPMRQRETGIIGAALTRPDVVVQLIVDGHHLSPEFVKVAWNSAKGRFALVTDAVAAAGMGDGTFPL